MSYTPFATWHRRQVRRRRTPGLFTPHHTASLAIRTPSTHIRTPCTQPGTQSPIPAIGHAEPPTASTTTVRAPHALATSYPSLSGRLGTDTGVSHMTGCATRGSRTAPSIRTLGLPAGPKPSAHLHGIGQRHTPPPPRATTATTHQPGPAPATFPRTRPGRQTQCVAVASPNRARVYSAASTLRLTDSHRYVC